jgi:hypothetical protein
VAVESPIRIGHPMHDTSFSERDCFIMSSISKMHAAPRLTRCKQVVYPVSTPCLTIRDKAQTDRPVQLINP